MNNSSQDYCAMVPTGQCEMSRKGIAYCSYALEKCELANCNSTHSKVTLKCNQFVAGSHGTIQQEMSVT